MMCVCEGGWVGRCVGWGVMCVCEGGWVGRCVGWGVMWGGV